MKMLERKMSRTTNKLIGNLNKTIRKVTENTGIPLKGKNVVPQSDLLQTTDASLEEAKTSMS